MNLLNLDIEKSTKIYFSIGEVAKMLDVNTSLIRFWEKEFEILKPKKNKKGNRQFTKKDVKNCHLIYHLVKEKGYTLEGAKQKLKENPEGVINNHHIISRLEAIKLELTNIKNQL